MRKIVIVVAKMRDCFFDLIRSGAKRYEVRDEPFEGAQAILYVRPEDGKELGLYRIKDVFKLPRSEDARLVRLSGISEDEFYELFPSVADEGPAELWVARIGEPINLECLLEETK